MTADGADYGPDPEPWAIFERSIPGWFRVSGAFPTIYVGCDPGIGGRAVITQLVIYDSLHPNPARRIDGTALRAIPLARIEASLNDAGRQAWALASAPNEPLMELERLTENPVPGAYQPRIGGTRARLTRPSRGDSEEFSRRVAEAYLQLGQASNKPAVEIANEAGVPVTTARRWINDARKRGYLPKGQRGRVG